MINHQDIVCVIPDGYTQEEFGEQEGVSVASHVAEVITFFTADIRIMEGVPVETHDLAFVRWFDTCRVPSQSRECNCSGQPCDG